MKAVVNTVLVQWVVHAEITIQGFYEISKLKKISNFLNISI
jgi:hypothetical protein